MNLNSQKSHEISFHFKQHTWYLWPPKKCWSRISDKSTRTQCIWCDYIHHAVLFNLKLSCLTFKWIFHTCLCLHLGNIFPSFLTHLHTDIHIKIPRKKTAWTWRVNFPHYKISRMLPTNFSSSSYLLKVHCHQCRIRVWVRKIFGLFIWLEVFFWYKIFPIPKFFNFFFNWIFNLCTSSEK